MSSPLANARELSLLLFGNCLTVRLVLDSQDPDSTQANHGSDEEDPQLAACISLNLLEEHKSWANPEEEEQGVLDGQHIQGVIEPEHQVQTDELHHVLRDGYEEKEALQPEVILTLPHQFSIDFEAA